MDNTEKLDKTEEFAESIYGSMDQQACQAQKDGNGDEKMNVELKRCNKNKGGKK